MANWKEYTLGDIAKVKGGKRLPKGGNLTSVPNAHPYIRVRDMGNRYLPLENLEYVPNEVFPSIKNYIVDSGDVILSIVGSVGLVSIVNENLDKASLTENCVKIIPENKFLHNEFLYYFLKSEIGQNEIYKKIVGAVQPKLPIYNINSISISAPDLTTQTRIAKILSSLDDKIELNNQINQNLEAFAQALFKQWFVDFEFPNENGQPYKSSGGEMAESELGRIPKSWSVCKLSTLIEITGGGTPKRSNEEYWDGDIPWFSIQDVPNESQVVIIDTLEKITDLGLNNSSTKILPKGTTIITARGTVGKLALVVTPMAMNQSCYGITGKDGIGPYFNYYNLKHAVKSLQQNTHGAVFDTITTLTFDTVSVAFGSKSLASYFDKIVESLMEQIEANVRENQNLINLRDMLLPKLIAGELELSK